MNKSVLVAAMLLISGFAAMAGDELRNGEIRNVDGEVQAWIAAQSKWATPVEFWEAYAAEQGGLTWGRGAVYPEYAKVKEHDLFMVEVKQGPCLMEFFHRRWRRANDVRRWDPAHNESAGCPHVFD